MTIDKTSLPTRAHLARKVMYVEYYTYLDVSTLGSVDTYAIFDRYKKKVAEVYTEEAAMFIVDAFNRAGVNDRPY